MVYVSPHICQNNGGGPPHPLRTLKKEKKTKKKKKIIRRRILGNAICQSWFFLKSSHETEKKENLPIFTNGGVKLRDGERRLHGTTRTYKLAYAESCSKSDAHTYEVYASA